MLAATYGVAMAARTNSQTEFRNGVLREHGRRIFDLMFGKDAAGRTTHGLTREYGRRLIELAALHNRKLFSPDERARSNPPYSNGGRIDWPEIETTEGEVHGVNSPFRMDFENYVLGRLVRGRSNYNFKHAGYTQVRAKALWRIAQLGWNAERFSKVDRAIDSERRFYGRQDANDKVDRYGKKYSWIAYFEVDGWLRDQRLLERGDGSSRMELDIDPSFPSPTAEIQLVCEDLLGDRNISLADWIKNGQIPQLRSYLTLPNILDEPGPWILLDADIARDDETSGRRLRAYISSFLIRQSDAKAFARCLTNESLTDTYVLEKPSNYHICAGEIPWCDAFPNTYAEGLRLTARKSKVRVKRKRPFFFLDGKPISTELLERQMNGVLLPGESALTEDELKRMTWVKRLVEVEEVREDKRKFWPLIPVYDLHWERNNPDNLPIGGITLAKQIAASASLVNFPQTYDLQTIEGERATYGTAYKAEDSNHEEFFFIRKNVLQMVLQKKGWSLVRVLWGERAVSYEQILTVRLSGELDNPNEGDFQAVCPIFSA
jgi:hypothetical protein